MEGSAQNWWRKVAASSASIDLGDKKASYRRNGVQEYIVWQVYENKLDWYYLNDGVYESLSPDDTGIIRSQVFPGLLACGQCIA